MFIHLLLSTVNPNPPEEDIWIKLPVHPCPKRHEDIPDFEVDYDYANLLNMICTTAYPLQYQLLSQKETQ